MGSDIHLQLIIPEKTKLTVLGDFCCVTRWPYAKSSTLKALIVGFIPLKISPLLGEGDRCL